MPTPGGIGTPVYVGTNWKMTKTPEEARRYARRFRALLDERRGEAWYRCCRLFLIPSFTALGDVRQALGPGTDVLVGAQNMHWEDRGAYTGEVSAPMLLELGVRLIELGHSERRRLFGETDTAVNLKVRAALRHGLLPLVCVGETAEEKEYGVTAEVVRRQVKIALHGVPAEVIGVEERGDAPLLIAYEPVWAIGEGGTPSTPEYADAVQAAVKKLLSELYGPAGTRIPVLYGGSVNRENAPALLAKPHVDGLFIGRAAWAAEGFVEILRHLSALIQTKGGSGGGETGGVGL